MRFWTLALVLGGCAACSQVAPAPLSPAVQQALASGPGRSCITPAPAEGLTIIEDGAIGLRSGGTLWVNRLPARCPGLRVGNTLIVEIHGSQICRGDHVRPIEPAAAIPGPVCILGDFVPYRRP
jgi:hypothetical protein